MTLRVRPEARADLLEAASWYEDREPGLGQALVGEVDDVIARIQAGPHHYRIAYRIARRALVRRFPFAVYFIETDASIIVIAVVHQRRALNILDARLDEPE